MAFTPSNIIGKAKYKVPAPDFSQSFSTEHHEKYYMYNSIVELRESRNTEFKAAQGRYIVDILPTSLAKYACAFANGEGGTLYLGICDDGVIKGIPWNNHQQDEWRLHKVVRAVMGRFLPKVPSHNVRIVPLYREHPNKFGPYTKIIHNKKVICIDIHAGALPDIYENGYHKVWLKRDGSVEILNNMGIKDLAISKYKQSLDLRGEQRAKDRGR